eukprot:1161575-Pelagomonas_calceolata.AAC.18
MNVAQLVLLASDGRQSGRLRNWFLFVGCSSISARLSGVPLGQECEKCKKACAVTVGPASVYLESLT